MLGLQRVNKHYVIFASIYLMSTWLGPFVLDRFMTSIFYHVYYNFLYCKRVFRYIIGITLTSKPVICTYSSPGPKGYADSHISTLLPQNIPKECEIILYDTFVIDINSKIECDTGNLFIQNIYLHHI